MKKFLISIILTIIILMNFLSTGVLAVTENSTQNSITNNIISDATNKTNKEYQEAQKKEEELLNDYLENLENNTTQNTSGNQSYGSSNIYKNTIFSNTSSITKPSTVPEIPPQNVLIIPPTKTIYKVGEKLDLSGLKITAIYANNKIEDVTTGYTVTGFYKNKEGLQDIKISYKGFSRTYEVRVGNSSTKVTPDETTKLPQTGDFFDFLDALYLIVGILSLTLIYIIFKTIKYSKIK